VFLQAEYSVLVEPNPLKHTISIKEAMIKNGDLGLGLFVKGAVDIDFQVHMTGGLRGEK
jgi:hypothetical protein